MSGLRQEFNDIRFEIEFWNAVDDTRLKTEIGPMRRRAADHRIAMEDRA